MNSRILLSLSSIVASLTLVAGATFAFFTDVATSTGNTFAAGNLVLLIDDENELDPIESVSASFGTGEAPLAPGESVDGFVSLHNGGSIPIAEVKIEADRTDADDNTLPSVLYVTSVKTGTNNTCSEGASDHTAAIEAGVGDNTAPLTLQELINTSGFDGLPGLAVDETYFLCMTTTMDSTAGDEYQGESATVDFIFTGHQHIDQ